MTCPCGHYDYVDSTAKTLADAMTCKYHSSLFRGVVFDPNEQEKEIANKMRLYQHSARCPVAFCSFLDWNPIYWCFIPILWDEAVTENIVHFRTGTSSSASFNVNPEMANAIAIGVIDNTTSCISFPSHFNLAPDDRSIILRYIIESLFIIHGETK